MEPRDPSLDSAGERQDPEAARITLRFEKFSSFVEEYASHLSLGGMFLATSEVRAVGEVVGFAIELTDGFRLVEGVGEVVWLRPRDGGPERPAGMALRFRALDETGRELILKILEEQVRSGGAPFEVDEVPADAVSTPGALPEPPASPPGSDAAGERAAESGDGPSPRRLEFDAPWGKELPAVPEEILEDTGSLAEPAAAGAPEDEPFRLAAEAALEIESLPELSPEESKDDGDLDPDLEPSPETPADDQQPPGAAAGAPADPPPPASTSAVPAAEAEADVAVAGVGRRSSSPAGGVEEIAARSAPASDGAVAAASKPRPQPAAPVHGAVLDYEHELAAVGGNVGGNGRSGGLRAASKPVIWIAGLAVVLTAAGGWWLWGRSPASPAPAATALDHPPSDGDPGGGSGQWAAKPAAASEGLDEPPAAELGAGGTGTEGTQPRPRGSTASRESRAAVREDSPPPPRPATAVRDISWQSDARGTWVAITLDGEADAARVGHDPLAWTSEKEQISLVGIDTPYLPATVTVDTPELVRIRTGLHDAGGSSELRLVFDLTASAAGLEVPQVSGERLRILVRRGSG